MNNKQLLNKMLDDMILLRNTIESLQVENKKLKEEIKKLHTSFKSVPNKSNKDLVLMELISTTPDHKLRCLEFLLENTEFLTGDDIARSKRVVLSPIYI